MLTPSRLHTHAGPPPEAELWRVALAGDPPVAAVLAQLEDERLPFALTGRWAGGGAILGSEPLAVAQAEDDPFAVIDELPAVEAAGGSPENAVGGGWFGWLGYRLGARIERLPAGPPRPHPLPEFHLAYYDHVLRRDAAGRWWFEALLTPAREVVLAERLEHLRTALAAAETHPVNAVPVAPLTLSAADAEHHLVAVADGVRRIAAGEIFQANLCLALRSHTAHTATELYAQVLTRTQPAYGAAFSTPQGGIASLSPELFLRRRGREVQTAPIKGTLPRPEDPQAAARGRAKLRGSVKDAAEHVMIVDLMRNDLGRVCVYGSVSADPEPTAEAHPGLWHLVSHVRGRLRPGVGDGELLRATFPPGSVTGAPKVQATHVIAALEGSGREVYTGAIGFASPLAGLELNVAIRTLELAGGALWLGAGGGIVADSDPHAELEEALGKARPVAAAIGTTVATAARGDPALGVFETLRVRDGRAEATDAHLNRLAGSLDRLYGLRLPADLPAALHARAAGVPGLHRLRVDAVPEGTALAVTLTVSPLPARPPAPVRVAIAVVPGGLGPDKLRDRAALATLAPAGVTALIADTDGSVLEAAWGNLWVREGERLITPPADGRLLPGVTRARLLALAPALGLSAAEEPISRARLHRADAIVLTSALRLAVAAALDGGPENDEPPWLSAIRAALSGR